MIEQKDERKKQEKVYSWLEDEESRFIYENKLRFNIDHDYEHIRKIVKKYVPDFSEHVWYPGKEKELIEEIKRLEKRVVIFGAGYFGEKILDLFVKECISVDFFCDNDEKKQHMTLAGVEIVSPIELKKRILQNDYIVIISTKYASDKIKEQLLQIGISLKNIYKFIDYNGISSKKQYFDNNILNFQQNEVFVDGGCFDFETSRLFLENMKHWGLRCKKIYAFEPDNKNFKRCEQKIEKLEVDNVELINAGMWSTNTSLHFSEEGTGSSHISKGDAERSSTISVISLDQYVTEKITFIKMDIEGAEMEALKGAENILKRDKPKLAICLYHKREDMWEIPYLIKSIKPEYKFFIRHYSNYEGETVLYAI